MAARAGDLVFYSGAVALDPDKGIPPGVEPLDGYPHHWSRINRELDFIFATMKDVLASAGSSLPHVAKLNSFHTDPADTYEALRLRGPVFGDEPPPSTLVLVPELPVPGARVAIDAIAIASDARRPRAALTTSTPGAPMPPHERIWGYKIYSKAARGGGFIFTSGRTNNVIGSASDARVHASRYAPGMVDHAAETTEMILDYLFDVLRSFGAAPEHVVKAEIHLDDLSQIAAIEAVWKKAFPHDPPARVFIPAKFPTTYTTIEIEFVAVDSEGPYRRSVLKGPDLPKTYGHEPIAVQAGPYVFVSGLMATDGETGLAPEARPHPGFPHHASPARLQTAFILDRLDAICRATGASLDNVVRRRLMATDLRDIGPADAVWRERTGAALPPTTYFRPAGDLPVPGCRIQYDVVLWAGSE